MADNELAEYVRPVCPMLASHRDIKKNTAVRQCLAACVTAVTNNYIKLTVGKRIIR